MDRHSNHKTLIAPLRAAMYDFEERTVRAAFHDNCTEDVVFRLAYPFESTVGVDLKI